MRKSRGCLNPAAAFHFDAPPRRTSDLIGPQSPFFFLGASRNELDLGPVWLLFAEKGQGKQWRRKPISLLSTSMSRTAGRLDLEKHARLEAGLIDPVSAIQQAPTAEHQRGEGLSFWQAVKDNVQVGSSGP
jgi:hypothetical protein